MKRYYRINKLRRILGLEPIESKQGYVFAPYVPLSTTMIMNESTINKNLSSKSRFGICQIGKI
jgi:hypothetical protein